ncbi:MAG: Crp/Fnr family transcriptional regulator [Caldicoprobacterales bacterium]|jgi:CRP-like cAMP-binding protein|nr:Crp/Fnr family transcriptional regulator [Clostridiales bacterium]
MLHNIYLMKQIPLLQSLSEEDMLDKLRNGTFKVTRYKKNSIVHFDGEKCTKFEVILSGKIAVDHIDESGRLLTISEFNTNDIIGGNLVFSKQPYYPMTISTQLTTEILEIEREALFDLLCQNPFFLRAYLEVVSDNAYILGNKIKHYTNKTIRESVMYYLNYESKKQKSSHIILNMTKKALAEKIGVQRTSLSRELAKMRNDGLIEFDRESITLLE